MSKNQPRVVVGTLTWNQKSDVLECLRSLVRLDYPNYEIVVVDNNSTDGTFEAVRQEFPDVSIVRHSENLGCAEGVNGEIRYALQAGADYLFIIANDALVEPATLTELVHVAEKDAKIGTVFPKVYHYGNDKKIWFAKGCMPKDIDWLRGRFTGFVQNVNDDGSFDQEVETALFPGGFCLVRIAAIKKAGFLDPDYFIYFDDADWLMRINGAGFSGRFAPRARAWHKPSSSMGMESESFYYYRARNQLIFYRRFAPKRVFLLFFIYYLYENCLRTMPGFFRHGKKGHAHAILLGLVDYLRGKRGAREFGKHRDGWVSRIRMKAAGILRRLVSGLRFAVKRFLGLKLKIKVRVNWNIGDEIMAISAYEALKEKYPHSEIGAQVRHPELLENNPFVDNVNGKEFLPDLYVDLHRERKGKSRLDYMGEIVGAPGLGLPKVYIHENEIEDAKKRWPLSGEDPLIAISPGARWFSRQWGRENWIGLAESFIRRYKATVFVLGKDEIPLPVGMDLIGKATLRETTVLLSQCHLFVGSDSGLVHLALAVGTPTVGLYGPLNPSYLIKNRPHFTAIWSEVECRGCWSDARMKVPDHCPKILPDCMSSIPVSRVLEASQLLLSKRHVILAQTL